MRDSTNLRDTLEELDQEKLYKAIGINILHPDPQKNGVMATCPFCGKDKLFLSLNKGVGGMCYSCHPEISSPIHLLSNIYGINNKEGLDVIREFIEKGELPKTLKKPSDVELFELLYEDTEGHWLTIWTKDSKTEDKLTSWFPSENWKEALDHSIGLSKKKNVYFGVGVRKENLGKWERGGNDDIIGIPAIWVDIDIADKDAHKKKALPPTLKDAVNLVNQFPLEPSALVHSGYGLHVYWIFKELWEFDSPEEREEAAVLLKKLEQTIRSYAMKNGWNIDPVADLARVLRVPGTLNHKKDFPVPVKLITHRETRYNPSDFEEYLIEIQEAKKQVAATGEEYQVKDYDYGSASLILDNCSFIQHCKEKAKELSEPEWYAMVTNVGRGTGGRELAHELSKPYSGYSQKETDKKIDHALKNGYPHTCEYIENELGFNCPSKDKCSSNKITAPVVYCISKVIKAKETLEKYDFKNIDPNNIFTQEIMENLAVLRKEDPISYAGIKQGLKGKVNLNDFEKAVKFCGLRIVGKNEADNRIQILLEDGLGYTKQKVNEQGTPEEVIVSNFTLDVKDKIILEDSEVLTAGLYINGQYEKTVELAPNAFLSSRELILSLKSTGVVWLGTEKDVQLLKATILLKQVPIKKGVECTGKHGNVFVFKNMVLGEEGPIDNKPIRVTSQSQHTMRSIQWPDKAAGKKVAERVYELLPTINEARIIGSVIGWTFALPWAAEIKALKGWGGFPHLIVWGTAGSGKTTLSQLILRLCGVPLSEDPLSLPRTKFTRMKAWSSTNLTPLFLDEYRPSSWQKGTAEVIHQELRSLYGGEIEERGLPSLGTRKYRLISPVIIAGEDKPRDPALDERIIAIQPRKGSIEKGGDYYKNFQQLQNEDIESFIAPYLVWSLQQKEWVRDLIKTRDDISKRLDKSNLMVPNRILNNLSLVAFGWEMWERYADYLGIKPEPMEGDGFKEALFYALKEVMPNGKTRNAFDNLMIFIAVMVQNGKLKPEIHYVLNAESNIVLKLDLILPEARKYARETERREEILGEDSYRGMISEMEVQQNSYVLSKSTLAYFAGQNRRRGVLIDKERLEELLEIEANIWDRGHSGNSEGENGDPY